MNSEIRKGIAKKIAMVILSSYIEGCEVEKKKTEGEASDYTDFEIKLDGVLSPVEIEECTYENKEEGIEIVERVFDKVKRKILKDFRKKEKFKESKAGIIVIIGFCREKLLKAIEAGSENVEIDVLVAKAYNGKNVMLKTLFGPEWWTRWKAEKIEEV